MLDRLNFVINYHSKDLPVALMADSVCLFNFLCSFHLKLDGHEHCNEFLEKKFHKDFT